MKDFIIFGSVVIYVALVLEMYRIKKLVKVQKELIEEYKKAYLLDQEIIECHEALDMVNNQIIANLKK